jgi:hypothetical protein
LRCAAASGDLALLEFKLLTPRVELDEQIALLDLFVEVQQRAHHATRGRWLEAVHRVVRLDGPVSLARETFLMPVR